MATTKTPTKTVKRTNSNKAKSRVGTNKLAPKKGFKLWMAALVVVLVAVAGYAVVNFSEASGYTFYRRGSEVTGGMMLANNKKDGSQGYTKYIQQGNFVSIYVLKSKLSKTGLVCVKFVPQSSRTAVDIEINNNGIKGSKVAYASNPPKPKDACVQVTSPTRIKASNFIRVTATYGNAYILSIYGRSR